MEKMSRVKKYEDLYETVNGENDELNEIESAVNSLRNPSDNNYDYNKMDEHFDDKGSLFEDTSEFKNEYLDSFIQEIKEYNLKKGVIESEDTNLDILKQLSAKQRLKRSGYQIDDELEQVDQKNMTQETKSEVFSNNKQNEVPVHEETKDIDNDVASQVKQLLNDEESSLFNLDTADMDARMDRLNEQTQKINILEGGSDVSKTADEEQLDEVTKQKIMEETQKIQVQLDATKDEMNNIQQKVDDSNKKMTNLLRVIIIILIALLLCGLFVMISGM